MSWNTIDTAPVDGSEILLWATVGSLLQPKNQRVIGRYERGWWALDKTLSHVTHWMPLEEPPASTQVEAA